MIFLELTFGALFGVTNQNVATAIFRVCSSIESTTSDASRHVMASSVTRCQNSTPIALFTFFVLISDCHYVSLVTLIHSNLMNGIFIVAAKRTPFGAFGGSLKALSATDLGVVSSKAALEQGNVDPQSVDAVYFGNVIQSCPDAAYLARHVGLKSGIPVPTPALTINRLCGSGFETVVQGANAIRLGDAHIALCGGTENMSAAPLQASGNDARWGIALGNGLALRDALWDGLTDTHANTPMGVTAENLAEKYNITRRVRPRRASCAEKLFISHNCSSPYTYFYHYCRNVMNMLSEVNRHGAKHRKRAYSNMRWHLLRLAPRKAPRYKKNVRLVSIQSCHG